jgi:tetratricopeptide (TPR) repeat protein
MKTFENYQLTTYHRPRCPEYWISIGELYYMANQFQDSFDALSRCIRLNRNRPEAWYNLGTLVSNKITFQNYCEANISQHEGNGQFGDAVEAYNNCLLKTPREVDVRERLDYVQLCMRDQLQHHSSGLKMKDIDLLDISSVRQVEREPEQYNIVPLRLRENYYGQIDEDELGSDEWADIDEEEEGGYEVEEGK